MSARLAVIILTKDEEVNLPACIDSLVGLDAEVWVVDSGSTDRTVTIAEAAGCMVINHPFENYSAQRNWAFDVLPISAPWTLCVDADERLTPELVASIHAVVTEEASCCSGYMMSRRTIFLGRWLRYGGQYPAWHLRLFRTGSGRCEDRLYDQHFIVAGQTDCLEGDLIDVLTSDITTWIMRHNTWASLEAAELMSGATGGVGSVPARLFGSPVARKRFLRHVVYRRMPLFVGPFLLWFYAYVFRLGFLDGIPGLVFYTLQRFWFRFLIDTKIYEARKRIER